MVSINSTMFFHSFLRCLLCNYYVVSTWKWRGMSPKHCLRVAPAPAHCKAPGLLFGEYQRQVYVHRSTDKRPEQEVWYLSHPPYASLLHPTKVTLDCVLTSSNLSFSSLSEITILPGKIPTTLKRHILKHRAWLRCLINDSFIHSKKNSLQAQLLTILCNSELYIFLSGQK